MTRLIFIALFSLVSINTYSNELDSLKKVVANQQKVDSAYADAHIKLARALRGKNIDSSIMYYQKAIEISNELETPFLIFKANHGIGICFGMKSDYAKSISHFNQALNYAEKIEHYEGIGDCYNTLGIVYKRMSDYPTSAEYYKKAMLAYDTAKIESGFASAHSNLGVLYDLMDEIDLAKKSYEKALNYYQKNDIKGGIATIEANLAVLHMNQNKYDSAIALLKKVYNYAISIDDNLRISGASTNLGNCFLNIENLDSAIYYLKRAESIALKFDLKQSLADIYFNFTKVSLKQNAYENSLNYANKTFQAAKQLNSFNHMADVESLYSQIYGKMGNYKKSLEHYKMFKQLQDSIFEERKIKAFKSQQVKMEVFEKDKLLAEKSLSISFMAEKLQLEYRWKWLLAITTVLFLLLGIVYYRKFRQKKEYSAVLEEKNSEIAAQNESIEEINNELERKMLRAQINPHFIFNALSAIQHFITENDKKSALKFLSKFSNLLRQVLESSINLNMLLKDEIDLLKIYIELEALRFSDGFEYEITIDENLDIYVYEIPTLLVQPFVENAILHGLLPKKGNRKLSIHFLDNDKSINCIVQDNGIGRKKSAEINQNKEGKSKSRGISLTEKRLSLLADNYDFRTYINYEDLIDGGGNAFGTKVNIQIPKP